MKRYWKASYTVEASLLIPLILISIFYGMNQGITMCEELREQSEYTDDLENYKGVEDFYAQSVTEKIKEDEDAN